MPKISDVVSTTLRNQGVQFELVTYQGLRGQYRKGGFKRRPAVYVITNSQGVAYVGSCSDAVKRMAMHRTPKRPDARGLDHVSECEQHVINLFYMDQPARERTRLEQLSMDGLRAEGVQVTNSTRSYGHSAERKNKVTCYSYEGQPLTQSQLSSRLGRVRDALRGNTQYKRVTIESFLSVTRHRLPETEAEHERSGRVERVLKGLDLAIKFGQCEFLANAMNERVGKGQPPAPLTADQIKARLVELELLAPWM